MAPIVPLRLKRQPELATVNNMNKAATISSREAEYKAQAEHYLAEAQRILRKLAAERRREKRGPVARRGILEEVKAILQGH